MAVYCSCRSIKGDNDPNSGFTDTLESHRGKTLTIDELDRILSNGQPTQCGTCKEKRLPEIAQNFDITIARPTPQTEAFNRCNCANATIKDIRETLRSTEGHGHNLGDIIMMSGNKPPKICGNCLKNTALKKEHKAYNSGNPPLEHGM